MLKIKIDQSKSLDDVFSLLSRKLHLDILSSQYTTIRKNIERTFEQFKSLSEIGSGNSQISTELTVGQKRVLVVFSKKQPIWFNKLFR